MRTSSPTIFIAAFGLFGLSALSARSAFADSTCATDADCVKGWACQVTASGGCGYACAAGQDCPPPPDCTPPPDVKSCAPGPCKADSDCATGMVCYSSTVTSCDPVPPCAAGADCPSPACSTTTQSACIPRYDAPCKADADCGAGFTCVPDSTNCGCASAGSAPSSGSGSADGGAPTPDPIPPMPCECPAATTSSCHALPVTCKTTADCATGWTCEAIISPSTCSMSAPAEPPTPAPGANGSADGGAPAPTPEPAKDAGASDPCPPAQPAMSLCVPPYFSVSGGTLGSSETGGSPIRTSGSAGGTSAGVPKAPGAASDSNGSNQTSTAGCSVNRGSNTGASGLALLALGLIGFARRRRAERAPRS